LALKRGVTGSEDDILTKAISNIDDIENAVQSTLKSSKATVNISDLIKTTQPLINSYRKAGNEAGAKALENRLMNIWQANGEDIPVAAANEIKRSLYGEVGNAYGSAGSEMVEGLKNVARGIKESITRKVPQISKLNEDLGFWGRARDAMVDKLARTGRNQAPGLRDSIMLAGGMAGAIPTNGLSMIPYLTNVLSTTPVKTAAANILNKTGQAVSKSALPGAISGALGLTGAVGGAEVGKSIPTSPVSPNVDNYSNNYQTTNEPTHTQSIPQQGNGIPQPLKDGDLDPSGQWRFDAKAGDFVPNEGGQSQGWTRETIAQAMLEDLQRTGGKNIPELNMIAQYAIPEETKKKPLTAVQQTLATNVESATRSIDKVEKLLSKDPNILYKNAVPGVGGRVMGASTYRTAEREIADLIARMRTGAVINDEEMKNYLSKLPAIGDSQEDIKYKMGELRFIFQSLKERLENQSGPDVQVATP
jgi:hypothetical protein